MQFYDRPAEQASEDTRVTLTRFLAFPAPNEGTLPPEEETFAPNEEPQG